MNILTCNGQEGSCVFVVVEARQTFTLPKQETFRSSCRQLQPGVDFTNVLRASYVSKDPKSAKIHWWLDCLLLLLGSGVNFINVLQAAFASADPESIKKQLCHQYLFTLLGSASAKAACRTLMKLTPEHVKAWVNMLLKLTLVVNFINMLALSFYTAMVLNFYFTNNTTPNFARTVN